MMKKLLALSLILGSMIFVIPSAEAKAASGNSVELNYVQKGWQKNKKQKKVWKNNSSYNQGRVRVVTRARIVRIGGRLYREVWQYRYLPNGRVQTRLLSRTRIYR